PRRRAAHDDRRGRRLRQPGRPRSRGGAPRRRRRLRQRPGGARDLRRGRGDVTTAAATRARVQGLAALCAQAGLDASGAAEAASMAYRTGFHGLQLGRLMAVAVRADATGALIAPALDRDGVTAAPTVCEPVLYDASSNGLPELVGALRGARRVGVEEDHL